ncbi:MAG: transporter substrate-binding domain-containing protein, partial [Pseudomonadota bacterium]
VGAISADAEMRQYQTSEEAYLDLQSGRIDAVLVDTIPGEEWIKSDPRNADFAPVADNLYDFPCFGEGIGIAVRKDEDDLREGLNAAIKAIRASGDYQTLSEEYFGRDIYGPETAKETQLWKTYGPIVGC